MNYPTFFLLMGIIAAFYFGNRMAISWIRPRHSAIRLIAYIVVVLFIGFLLTVIFSYFILKLFIGQI